MEQFSLLVVELIILAEEFEKLVIERCSADRLLCCIEFYCYISVFKHKRQHAFVIHEYVCHAHRIECSIEPELTPWIEDIMSKATDKFKNDAYVKDYYRKAQENQAIMNGMKDAPEAETAVPETAAPDAAPTPNELAKPVEEK